MNPKVVQRLLAKLKTYRSWHGRSCLENETGTRKDFTAPKDWILPGTRATLLPCHPALGGMVLQTGR